MKINEIVKNYDPITLIEFKEYLNNNIVSLCCKKDATSKAVHNSKGRPYCNNCQCEFSKNGKTKNGIQKYICPICKTTCSETTGTIVSNSKVPFKVWQNVINNLLDGLSLRRIAAENDISVLTSFRLRHKVLLALKNAVNNVELKGLVQSDEKYFNINLKGTKTSNMPRLSKKRSSNKSSYRGISHHKVCVISAIDEYDNLIFKIAGLGRGTTKMLEENLGDRIKEVTEINADSASAFQQFCIDHQIRLNAIPSGFYSDDNNHDISEINNVHSQLETWLKKFRGVSIRHFQQYLDWFTYIFMMKRKFELKRLKTESYKIIIVDANYIKVNDIYKVAIPIDLNIAYEEYQ